MKVHRFIGVVACIGLSACTAGSQADIEPDLWGRLAQGGYVLLMTHTSAPSAQFVAADLDPNACAGQNHLSDAGRSEARQLGEKLRSHSVPVGRVLTSHDCRCIETAAIVFGRAEPWSVIDNTRDDNPPLVTDKSIALREAISRWTSSGNLALVSHRSNIESVLGEITRPAQVLVIEPLGDAGFRLVGSLSAE